MEVLLECNCHNKAKDCYYDEAMYNQRSSLNIVWSGLGERLVLWLPAEHHGCQL